MKGKCEEITAAGCETYKSGDECETCIRGLGFDEDEKLCNEVVEVTEDC